MWQQLSSALRDTILFSEEEARLVSSQVVDPEHLFLGFLRIETSMACKILSELGFSPGDLEQELRSRAAIEAKKSYDAVNLSPESRDLVDIAYSEAKKLSHATLGTEHLLLALIIQNQGLAGQVLAEKGITLVKVRESVSLVSRSKSDPTVPTTDSPATSKTGKSHSKSAWEQLTPMSRGTMFHAQEVAQELETKVISPEHLLLGMFRLKNCLALELLTCMKVDLQGLEAEIRLKCEAGVSKSEGTFTLAPGGKRVIDIAMTEVKVLGDKEVSTKHLLLGIIQVRGSVAGKALETRGVTVEDARIAIRCVSSLEDGSD